MNNFLMTALIIESVIIVIILALFFWLLRAQTKLKRQYQMLNDSVQGNGNDIAGLCSAALAVDSRIAAVDKRVTMTDGLIDDLAAKIGEMEQTGLAGHPDHPYSIDIRKVRSGASVNELMQNSGLSHDEAALLIRLHGAKTDS